MNARRRPKIVEVGDIEALPPGIEPCRDDRCSVDGVHAKHRVYGRGRPSRIVVCDKCFNKKPCNCT